MFIIYTPEGGDPKEYDASTLRVSEVSIVQRTIDMKWAEISAALGDDDPEAMRGVAWVIEKRSQPTLRFADFDPGIGEMVTRLDKKEVRNWIEQFLSAAASKPEVTREQLAAALRDLPDAAHDPEHARQLIAEMTADPKDSEAEGEETGGQGENPNQTSTSPEPSTSGSSATSSTSPPIPSTV